MTSSSRQTLSAQQSAFVASVLSQDPRIAVFDCDGTLWAGDSGAGFFYWELKQGLIAPAMEQHMRARYDEYKAGRVGESEMCGEMVTMHAGIPESRLLDAARRYFDAEVAARIFPEMLELVSRLRDNGCDIWAVSSTNNWVVEAGVARFGLPPDRVLAACVKCENGSATGELIRVPSGDDKAVAIRTCMPALPDAVFGNSIHDLAMLEVSKLPYCINPNPDLAAIAQERRWTVYWPAGTNFSA